MIYVSWPTLVSENLAKTKRILIQLRPLHRLRRPSTTLKDKLAELFIDPTVTTAYELSTLALQVKENKCLIGLQNTVRRMILGLQSRKGKRDGE